MKMATDNRGRKLPRGIRLRGKTYEGRITYMHKTYTVHGKTITETQRNMTELRYRLQHGTFAENSEITLDEWFFIWLDEYKKRTIKKGTYETYKNYYSSLVRPILGNARLQSITGIMIQSFYNSLSDSGYSFSAIRIVSVLVHGSLQQAVRNNLLMTNPAAFATLPKNTPHPPRTALTREQQSIFMSAAQKSYLYNFFAVMLRTGLRNGELRGIKYSDIDFDRRVLRVQRTLKYIDGQGYFEDTPKTISSVRDIPLTEDLIELLRAQKNYWGFSAEHPDRYLFCNKKGLPLSRDKVQKELDHIINTINKNGFAFDRITPHVFRHTFATRAIEAGMSPQVLKTILGHSSLAITMDLYSHVMPDIRSKEMDKISCVF